MSVIFYGLHAHHQAQQTTTKTSVTTEQVARRLSIWIDDRLAIAKYFEYDWHSLYKDNLEKFEQDAMRLMSGLGGVQAVNWMDNDWTIQVTVPRQENEGAHKQNLHEHPSASVRNPVQKASETRTATRIAEPLELYQGGVGFVVYCPITSESGEALGFFNLAFKIESIVAHSLSEESLRKTIS
jgi:sensor domain CHASE-containing protein